jgi:hypothetical protein
MTESLEVLFIPHEIFIALMRDDVVNICGRHQEPFLQALLAKRMLKKEALAEFPPTSAITSR